MDAQQLQKQLDSIDRNNLVFQPDYSEIDPKRHYVYCEVQGQPVHEHYHRDIAGTEKELIMRQRWRSTNEFGRSNPIYADTKSSLEDYLKSYKNGGYELFEKVVLKLMNSDGPMKLNSLPALKSYFKSESERSSIDEVLERFARIVRIALTAEDILPERIYRMVDDVTSATFSQEQCAALVARMFFRTTRNRSFVGVLNSERSISVEKLKFLMTYFDTVTKEKPTGIVSFRKVKVDNFFEDKFEEAKNRALKDVTIHDNLLIEQTALCSQVDFANKHIGGGVLRLGAVQEEIRFLMCPEMFVSMLLFDEMEPNEAISIVGAQVYSSYTGYGNTLKWSSLNEKDGLQNRAEYRDRFGRLQCETIAINAIKFFGRPSKSIETQLMRENLNRELMKASVGFSGQKGDFSDIPIVSGWWGCGVYNGNKPLKFLIQVLAAGIADRPLYFCTFGDTSMSNKCRKMMRRLEMDKITIGELYDILLKSSKADIRGETHVFDFIEKYLCSRASR